MLQNFLIFLSYMVHLSVFSNCSKSTKNFPIDFEGIVGSVHFKPMLCKGQLYTRRDVAKITDMTGLKTENLLFIKTVLAVMIKWGKMALVQEMDRKGVVKQHELMICSPDKVNK